MNYNGKKFKTQRDLKKGREVNLKGKSTFEFRDREVIKLTDKS